MKLFGNHDPKKWDEETEAVAEREMQAAAEDIQEAADKAEAIANSGLVLSIEGLDQENNDQENAPFSLKTDSAQDKKTENDNDDDFLRELHALLDEKGNEAPPQTTDEPMPEIDPDAQISAEASHNQESSPEHSDHADSESELADPQDGSDLPESGAQWNEVEESEPDDTTKKPELSVPESDSESEPASEPKTDEPLTRDTKTFASVSYESMAKAMEQSSQSRTDSPTRKTHSAIDDDTLLAELYTLMGDVPKAKRNAQQSVSAQTPEDQQPAPADIPAPVRIREKVQEAAVTADAVDSEQMIRPAPIAYENREPTRRDSAPIQAQDNGGVPGWLKGIFLLILSAALSGMTLYAVMMDVLGKVF